MIHGKAVNDWTELQRSEHEVDVSARSLDMMSESLIGALPSSDDMSSMLVKRVRLVARNIEFIPVKRPWRRLWLGADASAPGYARQKIYGAIMIDYEIVEMIAEKSARVIQALCAEFDKTIGELATLVRERVATFRAYNQLNENDAVTVRNNGPVVRYLTRHGEGGVGLRRDQATDSYRVYIGSYFHICPPGEEFVPDTDE